MAMLNTYVCRLNFRSFVHFGGSGPQGLLNNNQSLYADTIFSALCSSAAEINLIRELIQETERGNFILSDGFPYNEKGLYLPKPYLPPKHDSTLGSDDLKVIKKLDWILLEDLQDIIKNNYVVRNRLPENPRFGEEVLHTKNKLTIDDDSEIYDIQAFRYYEGSGIYFIFQTSEMFVGKVKEIIRNLSYQGIGGKRSIGYGQFQFTIEENKVLNTMLQKDGNRYILLTTSKHFDHIEDFDQAYYGLAKRSGFYRPHLKRRNAARKKTQFFFKAGSSFVKPYTGSLYEVSFGQDQIYRYSLPMFLGVEYND